jgi:hypothetical protein
MDRLLVFGGIAACSLVLWLLTRSGSSKQAAA